MCFNNNVNNEIIHQCKTRNLSKRSEPSYLINQSGQRNIRYVQTSMLFGHNTKYEMNHSLAFLGHDTQRTSF